MIKEHEIEWFTKKSYQEKKDFLITFYNQMSDKIDASNEINKKKIKISFDEMVDWIQYIPQDEETTLIDIFKKNLEGREKTRVQEKNKIRKEWAIQKKKAQKRLQNIYNIENQEQANEQKSLDQLLSQINVL